jgi:hypothetical protein
MLVRCARLGQRLPFASFQPRRKQIVVKLRKVGPEVFNPKPTVKKSPSLSPAALARQAEQKLLTSRIRQIKGAETVFRVSLEPNEKPLTVRRHLLVAAEAVGKKIAIRQEGDRTLYIGLMTPERQPKRGRRRKAES